MNSIFLLLSFLFSVNTLAENSNYKGEWTVKNLDPTINLETISFTKKGGRDFKLLSIIKQDGREPFELLCYPDLQDQNSEQFPTITCLNSVEGYLSFKFQTVGGDHNKLLMTTVIPTEGKEFTSILTRISTVL